MTPTFIAALVGAWMVVSFVACVVLCMASSRFSARAEQQQFEREHAVLRQAQAQSRRARRPIAVRMEGNGSPIKVKVG